MKSIIVGLLATNYEICEIKMIILFSFMHENILHSVLKSPTLFTFGAILWIFIRVTSFDFVA